MNDSSDYVINLDYTHAEENIKTILTKSLFHSRILQVEHTQLWLPTKEYATIQEDHYYRINFVRN